MSFHVSGAEGARSFAVVAIVAAGLCGALTPTAAQQVNRATAVTRALERAPEAAADRAVRNESAALIDAAGGALANPRLSLEGEGDGVGPFGAEDRLLRLGLSQELDVHGRRGARRELARAEGAVTEAAVSERETALATRTSEAYGALLLARRRVALADSLAAASTRLVAAARDAQRRETVSPYALRVLARDEARLADDALRARGAAAAADAALRSLLLATPDEPLVLVDDLDEAAWTCTPDTLTARALAAHPALREARAGEQQLGAESALLAREGRAAPEFELFVVNERAHVEGEAFGPTIDAVPGFDGFSTAHTIFGAGITVSLPFAHTNAWESSRARLSTVRAAAQRRRLEAGIAPAVRAACATLAAAQERVVLHAFGVAEAGEDGVRLATAYREGRVDLDAYLAQRDRLAATLTARLDAIADAEAARTELSRVSGLDPVTLAAFLGGAPGGTSR